MSKQLSNRQKGELIKGSAEAAFATAGVIGGHVGQSIAVIGNTTISSLSTETIGTLFKFESKHEKAVRKTKQQAELDEMQHQVKMRELQHQYEEMRMRQKMAEFEQQNAIGNSQQLALANSSSNPVTQLQVSIKTNSRHQEEMQRQKEALRNQEWEVFDHDAYEHEYQQHQREVIGSTCKEKHVVGKPPPAKDLDCEIF